MAYFSKSRQSSEVLVVGGSLVGLSAAVFLAKQGVRTVVVEKHPGSSPHPRAIGYTPRTMELFRAVGLGAAIPEAPAAFRLLRARVESLAGAWYERSSWTPDASDRPKIEYSPCQGAAMAQDRLESILRAKAIELGADIRLNTRLQRFEQDANGVDAYVRGSDGEYVIRASYMIAADGQRSPVREALGIGRQGRGYIRTQRSVLFTAPLDEYLNAGVSQFEIDQPDFNAFLTTYRDGRWVLMFSGDVELDEAGEKDAIERAIGRSDLDVDIITRGRWELSALVATSFGKGRIFLAGDSAHVLPPSRGGYGANTGIQDAYNLAWKVAAVVSGSSRPALLETYDAERRPVAWLRHQQIFARPDYREVAGDVTIDAVIDDDAIEFGELYRSAAVIGAGVGLPPALRPDRWAGQPGTRMPHLGVVKDGARRSTLDLNDCDWLLISADSHWSDVARAANAEVGLRLRSLQLGSDFSIDDEPAFRAAFGIGIGGATLIRPDGCVAWRSVGMSKDARSDLMRALGECAARDHELLEDAPLDARRNYDSSSASCAIFADSIAAGKPQ